MSNEIENQIRCIDCNNIVVKNGYGGNRYKCNYCKAIFTKKSISTLNKLESNLSICKTRVQDLEKLIFKLNKLKELESNFEYSINQFRNYIVKLKELTSNDNLNTELDYYNDSNIDFTIYFGELGNEEEFRASYSDILKEKKKMNPKSKILSKDTKKIIITLSKEILELRAKIRIINSNFNKTNEL